MENLAEFIYFISQLSTSDTFRENYRNSVKALCSIEILEGLKQAHELVQY